MNIPNLIIEVTRRCNMQCDHCLRGCQQAKDIDHAYIDRAFSIVDSVNTLTITGGEPSLNVQAIEYILSSAELHGVSIDSFYIVTNGLKVKPDFVIACLKLYAYCECKEMCQVHVSNDYYHSCEDSYNTELLDGLSFFSRKFSIEGESYESGLINEGFAAEHGMGYRENKDHGFEIDTDYGIEEGEVYLNCNGDIVSGCDWSYESQEKHKVCRVEDLSLDALSEYNQC